MDPKPPEAAPRPRGTRRHVAVLVAVFVLLAISRPAGAHLRAASLLLRFADPHATGPLATYGTYEVDEAEDRVALASGEARARLYVPRGRARAPRVVITHGGHPLGIAEPPLMRLARAIAATGVTVMTPEVRELADYRVAPSSIDTIGAAAHALRERLGEGRVGLMGMSFAGGLSLLAAADPRWADDVSFVVAVGAQHDLARVSRFFATNHIERPDGRVESLEAHDYGALVLVYSHIEAFFPEGDVPAARDALRLWLWEEQDQARLKAAELSPASRERMQALFERRIESIAPELIAEIDRSGEAMGRVSPRGHLASVAVPVFLLHGAGDTVIPATETLWLAQEVPEGRLEEALVSPAMVHVELEGAPPLGDRLALVHFMAGVLETVEAAGR